MAENFAAYATSSAENQLTYAGSKFSAGQAGLGITGGFIEGNDENLGAGNARLADENLEMRHLKRGTLTMANEGENSNGA